MAGPASGVHWHKPKAYPLHRESVPLGVSPLSILEIAGVLERLGREWRTDSYDLLGRNCTDFAAQLVAELRTPEPFPAWVHGIAKRLVGAGLAPAGARRRQCCCS